MTDGYYFTIALKDTTDPETGIGSAIGWNAVLWYKDFKSGGTNDGETPDFNLQIRAFYPLGNFPPLNDPEILGDHFGNQSITFPDGSSITGSIEFNGVNAGDAAGRLTRNVKGIEPVSYTIIKGDGRVFYTDDEGVQYKCMHFARNPLIVG